ncbi:MAG: carbohydrate ABC transporter permease [Bacilli bacterium]
MNNRVKISPSNPVKRKGKIQKCKQDKIFNVVNISILVLCTIIFLYPLIFVVSASFTKPSDVLAGRMFLFPTSLYFEGYEEIFKYEGLWKGFINSVIIVVFGSALNMAVTFTVGYALSRRDFYGRKFFLFFFIFAMFFSGGLIPFYLLVANTLRMNDSLLALIIPSAVSVWNIILAKTYFSSSLSEELLEAAKIDGCSNLRFFFRIALPLAKPIIAVILLYNVVGRWNSYFDALIFLQNPDKYPLQLVIRNLISQNDISTIDPGAGQITIDNMYRVEGMKYGVIILSTIPMLVIYPFVQKYFIKGIMVGSLKG